MANQPKKYKKFVATAATATLVASAIVPVASAAGFTDVENNTHKEAINALADAGIINGYADGTFKPNQTINRGQVVKLLGRWLETEGYEAPADWATKQYFNDLPLTAEKELLKYAALTKDAGVFAGSNGNLNYTQSMQRQQMAVVLVRAINEIYDLDLVAEYKAEKFKSEISDLDKAFSAEQREAITALDYAELTDAAKQANKAFNPANSITRGQFASFLYRTINIDVETGVDASVKAINSTTVEVTFDEEVDTDNVKAENFKIEGLEVKNASVKQTNKKVVVLTTAAQTADKEYTVSYKGEEIGKFKGIAAVIPTAVKLTTASEQGVIGKEVTLKATVTVPEGQSKENVPVTFNIVNDKNTNEKIEKVAYTNAEGVATYSYTRYYASVDSVTAYATDKSTVFSSAKVYWANETQLAITEKTADNVLSNGAKKVYEISAPQKAGQYVFVAFENNLGVTTDKLTRSVFVEGTGLWTQNTTNNITETPATSDQYPYEITNGANRVVPVLLDSKGKANLVLSGTNGKVKPVVYAGELKTNYNFFNNNNPGSKITDFANVLYNPTALQAKAAEVSFEIKHTLGLTIEAKGVANAAVAISGTKQTGGRDYVATYVDKDGKPAKAGDVVYVALPYDAKHPTYLVDEDGKQVTSHSQKEGYTYYQLAVKGKEGKVEFTVTSTDEQAWAEPIVFINNGTGPDANKTFLDASDLQAKGAATYFTKEIQYQAELEALDSKGDDTKSVLAGGSESVEYKYNLLDQNGKPRAFKSATNVSFNVTSGTSELTVTGANEGTVTVTPGNPRTVTTTIAAGELSKSIKVTSKQAGSVTAYATASRVGAGVLPSTDSKTVIFAATSTVAVSGTVTKVEKEVVYIDGVPYSLLDATYLSKGSVVPTLAAFKADYLKVGAPVTVSKDSEGKLTFNVVDPTTTNPGELTSVFNQVNAATTQEQVLAALKKLDGFNNFIKADQDDIAAGVFSDLGTALYASPLAFQTKYNTLATEAKATVAAIADLDATIADAETVVKNAVVGTAVGQYTQANIDILKADILAAKANKTAVVNGTVKSSAGTNANKTALNTADTTLKAAVATFKATAVTNDTIQAAALAAVQGKLDAIKTANAGTGATAADYTAALTALKDNAKVLGLTLDKFNARTATEKETVLDAIASTTFTTAAQLDSKIAAEVAKLDPATVASAELTDNNTLTITFSNAVTLSGTATAGTVDFTNATGGIGHAVSTTIAGSTTKTLVITLTDADADGLKVGSVISLVKAVDGAAPITFTDANGHVLTDFSATVVAPK
ncbi:S-layer homology domain-containing protein [Lysinibacillus sp. NPDC058147]|uniref:S-layer homology domain-containing protein n=1 Tax=unclassified Lysinibacillus TaxID=2636778 RepID=UPI0036DC418B